MGAVWETVGGAAVHNLRPCRPALGSRGEARPRQGVSRCGASAWPPSCARFGRARARAVMRSPVRCAGRQPRSAATSGPRPACSRVRSSDCWDYYEITGPPRPAHRARRGRRPEALVGGLRRCGADYQQLSGWNSRQAQIAVWHLDVYLACSRPKAMSGTLSAPTCRSGQPRRSMIERLVPIRMRRQQVLDRDPPLELSTVIDESLLRRRTATTRSYTSNCSGWRARPTDPT